VETGQRTIVVNTDFRRPRLAASVTTSPPGDLPFELSDLSVVDPTWLLSDTVLPDLSLLDLNSIEGSAGDLARATAQLLPRLQDCADAIVIDTSPLGATAEVLEAVPLADVIVLVARIGQTTVQTAQRAIDVLRDVSTAPVVLVLTGLRPDRNLYYEYSEPRRKPRKPESKAVVRDDITEPTEREALEARSGSDD